MCDETMKPGKQDKICFIETIDILACVALFYKSVDIT